MLRYLAPYLALACVVVVAGGVAYSVGATGVLGAYGAALLATLVSGAGYARWDARRHPPQR